MATFDWNTGVFSTFRLMAVMIPGLKVASRSLSRESHHLKIEVEKFVAMVRAG